MSSGGHPSAARHLAGLGLALALGLGCLGLDLTVPILIQGTVLQRAENLVIFLSIVALLSLAERIWVLVTARLNRPPPE
jgi:hypothetical protein